MPNIKLKDQNGEFVTYNGVNVIGIPDEQGEPQLFRQPCGKPDHIRKLRSLRLAQLSLGCGRADRTAGHRAEQ